MISAWRLDKAKHAKDSFSGHGARLVGGRWNRKGTAVVYASDSLSLSLLEKFVHLGHDGARIKFVYFRIRIPENVAIEKLTEAKLSKDWKRQPPLDATQKLGTDWVNKGTSAVLQVPSVLVPGSFNYLLNPSHADFRKIRIDKPKPISMDQRMWKK